MRIQVLYFASAREAAGVGAETLEVPAGARVASLRALLGTRHPRLAAAWPTTRFAVGERFAADDEPLETGSVVALLPPVSGG